MGKHRKTREEKIIAELRHKLQVKQNYESAPVFTKDIKTEDKKVIEAPKQIYNINTSFTNKQNAVLNYDYSYVRRDLIKTILLTIAGVFAFIVLYWRMEIRV